MPWIYALVGLLIGIVIGVVISRLMTPEYKQQKSLKKELDSSKFEHEQQRQELIDHFAQTADMLDILGKDYTKLYQHMAKTSSDLLPNLPDQDNHFDKKVTTFQLDEAETKNAPKAPKKAPKDYANGASGLFNGTAAAPKPSKPKSANKNI